MGRVAVVEPHIVLYMVEEAGICVCSRTKETCEVFRSAGMENLCVHSVINIECGLCCFFCLFVYPRIKW